MNTMYHKETGGTCSAVSFSGRGRHPASTYDSNEATDASFPSGEPSRQAAESRGLSFIDCDGFPTMCGLCLSTLGPCRYNLQCGALTGSKRVPPHQNTSPACAGCPDVPGNTGPVTLPGSQPAPTQAGDQLIDNTIGKSPGRSGRTTAPSFKHRKPDGVLEPISAAGRPEYHQDTISFRPEQPAADPIVNLSEPDRRDQPVANDTDGIPLVRGGQGRTDEEVAGQVGTLLCVLSLAAVVVLVGLILLGLYRLLRTF